MSETTGSTSASLEIIAECIRATEEPARAAEECVVEIMEEIRSTPDEERHRPLVEWARSDWWHPMMMLYVGWPGELARSAWRALKIDLDADTPGKRWNALAPAVGRESITRLLGVDKEVAGYATAAFRTWYDDDGRTWIAGAIGSPPFLDAKRFGAWRHIDIRDVILWDPRTNEARIAGEHRSTSAFVMPDLADAKIIVWGDCGAFFRAWAARRARTGRLALHRSTGSWVHPVTEASDGGLPGGLLVGSYLRALWPHIASRSVVAGEGVTPAELHFAATRAAGIPSFGEA